MQIAPIIAANAAATAAAASAANSQPTIYRVGKFKSESKSELRELCLEHFNGYYHNSAQMVDVKTYSQCVEFVYPDSSDKSDVTGFFLIAAGAVLAAFIIRKLYKSLSF